MSLDGWSIKKYVTDKLNEYDGFILKLGKKVLILEAQLNTMKEEICQVRKHAQHSQKEQKPTKTASTTKVDSPKGKKVATKKSKAE